MLPSASKNLISPVILWSINNDPISNDPADGIAPSVSSLGRKIRSDCPAGLKKSVPLSSINSSILFNANFEANYIITNPADVAEMELTKTSTGEYTLPMFVPMADGITRVANVPVVANNGVTSGDYLIGDFTKSNLRMREDVNIQVGYINDDFTRNMMTVLCEARACHFVKSNYVGAFVTGTFATDKAVILLPVVP